MSRSTIAHPVLAGFYIEQNPNESQHGVARIIFTSSRKLGSWKWAGRVRLDFIRSSGSSGFIKPQTKNKKCDIAVSLSLMVSGCVLFLPVSRYCLLLYSWAETDRHQSGRENRGIAAVCHSKRVAQGITITYLKIKSAQLYCRKYTVYKMSFHHVCVCVKKLRGGGGGGGGGGVEGKRERKRECRPGEGVRREKDSDLIVWFFSSFGSKPSHP